MSLARASHSRCSRGDEAQGARAFEEALTTAKAEGQKEWIWRTLEGRARLVADLGQPLLARRDIEEALAVLEEIAVRLPRDLREVYWDDARRRQLRAMGTGNMTTGPNAPPPPKPASRAGARATQGTVTQPPLPEDRLSRILEINRELAAEHDLPRLLERVTDHAIALFARRAGLRDPADRVGELTVYASRDRAGDDPHARFSRSIAEKVISTGEQVVSQSARDDDRMAGYLSVHQLMLQSVACVPIARPSGKPIGALYLETRLRPGTQFTEELPTLAAFADQVAIAIENARLVTESAGRAAELEVANTELLAARERLEELLGHRTAQLDEAQARSAHHARGAPRTLRLPGARRNERRRCARSTRSWIASKDTDVPVLITGESGTGKEIVARAIHNAGRRSKGTFTGINCGAIPEHLLESELFGHVRGAFTGADREHKGLFREADGGTLLLDEIGEMPQEDASGALARAARKGRPRGRRKQRSAGRRATHRRDQPRSRGDGRRVDVPRRPLLSPARGRGERSRRCAIGSTTCRCSSTISLKIFAARFRRDKKAVSREALRKLSSYAWPGNVRQLENVLLNAWVLSDRPELYPDDFDLPPPGRRSALPAAEAPKSTPRHAPPSTRGAHRAHAVHLAHARRARSAARRAHAAALRRMTQRPKEGEKERMVGALRACNWNRVKAAQMMGVPRRTFYRRLKEYGIQ